MSASSTRRRHKRYEVRDLRGGLLFRAQVTVRDISVSGLSFETTERLKVGRPYSLRISNSHESVDLSGTIRWCHMARTAHVAGAKDPVPLYEAGLAFDDVLSERARSILRVIEENVVVSLEKRVTGRFTAEPFAPLELESRYDFEVLKLSLSGMLVRTHLEASVGARFGMEVSLRDGSLVLDGRVAFVQRKTKQWWGETPTELGIEFVDLPEPTRTALTSFIANELEPAEPEAGAASLTT